MVVVLFAAMHLGSSQFVLTGDTTLGQGRYDGFLIDGELEMCSEFHPEPARNGGVPSGAKL